jgi:hypothetical protein
VGRYFAGQVQLIGLIFLRDVWKHYSGKILECFPVRAAVPSLRSATVSILDHAASHARAWNR